jgi:hypothetical protein
MKNIKKKIGMMAVAGAIALGGVGAADLAQPLHKAEAASSYGVSMNTTKANYTTPEDVVTKFKNDNSYGMTLQYFIEKKDKATGQFYFVEYSNTVKLAPGQAYTHNDETTLPDLWEVWDHGVTETFRINARVYKGTQADWNTNQLQYLGTLATSPFNVTFN